MHRQMLTGSELCSEVICKCVIETGTHVPIDTVLLKDGMPLASSEDLLTHNVAELGHGGVLGAQGAQKLKEPILPS